MFVRVNVCVSLPYFLLFCHASPGIMQCFVDDALVSLRALEIAVH